jgi:hypothetical protein
VIARYLPVVAVAVSLVGWRGAALVAVVAVAGRWRVRRGGPLDGPGVDAVSLVVLTGVRAGLSVALALEEAARVLGEPVAEDLRGVLRRARREGLGPALAATTGRLAPLTVILARSAVTGAAPGPALAGLLESRRSEERARMLESARTLPVRLLVPISLLLLPGLVALAMGPALADQLDWLVGGVLP